MAFRSLLVFVMALLSLSVITFTYPVDPDEPLRQSILQRIANLRTSTTETATRLSLLKDSISKLIDLSNVYKDFESLDVSIADAFVNNSQMGQSDYVSEAKLHNLRDKILELNTRLHQVSAGMHDNVLISANLRGRDNPLHEPQNDVNSTFVPPPKTDITPDLISESLVIQPQDTAIVSSVMPYPDDGVISYHVQLNGLFASTMVLNASTSMPCDTVGSNPGPNLVLLPKAIKNEIPQSVVPNCLVIAVNMYRSTVINYWIQKEDGSIFSLIGDNKIHHFDLIDTSMDTSLVLRTATGANTKREADNEGLHGDGYNTVIGRREIIPIDCEYSCPSLNMNKIVGAGDTCGCVSSGKTGSIQARGISAPDIHTATMTSEACSKMTCINNGGKPAVYNPFSRSCWCLDPVFVEVNPSGVE